MPDCILIQPEMLSIERSEVNEARTFLNQLSSKACENKVGCHCCHVAEAAWSKRIKRHFLRNWYLTILVLCKVPT